MGHRIAGGVRQTFQDPSEKFRNAPKIGSPFRSSDLAISFSAFLPVFRQIAHVFWRCAHLFRPRPAGRTLVRPGPDTLFKVKSAPRQANRTRLTTRICSSHLQMLTSHARLRSSHERTRTSQSQMLTSHARVRTSHSHVRSSHLRLRTSHSRLRSSHSRLRSPHLQMRCPLSRVR